MTTERATCLEKYKSEAPDVIVAGGGIMGAGIAREAALAGLRVLLLEGMDFGWGASSCSSKMIHGGLRYLQTGRFDITYHSVQERGKLMAELPGLILPQRFVIPAYSRRRKMIFGLGLWIYDRFSRGPSHRRLSQSSLFSMFPELRKKGLCGGFVYEDGLTDDVRVVLRNVHDLIHAGGDALNYMRVVSSRLLDNSSTEVTLQDHLSGEKHTLQTKALVNATGFHADALRVQRGWKPMMRPLRGSHLVFSQETLPAKEVLVFDHPLDGRSVFLVPWQGCTFVGTTEADDRGEASTLPTLTADEQAYLLQAARYIYPQHPVSEGDILSVWAGVRPIVSAGKKNAYKEPRDIHILYQEGMLTVAGGKLTTFRRDAVRALREMRQLFPALGKLQAHAFSEVPEPLDGVGEGDNERLWQHSAYGEKSPLFRDMMRVGEAPFGNTPFTAAHLRFALRYEWVQHLDDLLIRRTRVGLLLPDGGASILPMVRELCLEVGWSEERFLREKERYLALIQDHYQPLRQEPSALLEPSLQKEPLPQKELSPLVDA